MPKRPTDRPTNKVFLAAPADYYDMTPEQQDEVCLAMADIFIRELGMNDAQPKRTRARPAARPKR